MIKPQTGVFENGVFYFPVRVYYEDTDSQGFIYYANYLKFASRARTEFLRYLGFDVEVGKGKDRAVFVARHLEIDYKNSGFFGDALEVSCEIEKLGHSSLILKQCVTREGTLLAQIKITLVMINVLSHKPVRIEETLRNRLLSLLKTSEPFN